MEQMLWFPFDIEICYLYLVPEDNLQNFVDITLKEIFFKGNRKLGSFVLLRINACLPQENDTKGFRIAFVMRRYFLWPMLANILPMLLMTIIGHLTFYIKPDSFDTAIQVLITTMLVLTTQ